MNAKKDTLENSKEAEELREIENKLYVKWEKHVHQFFKDNEDDIMTIAGITKMLDDFAKNLDKMANEIKKEGIEKGLAEMNLSD